MKQVCIICAFKKLIKSCNCITQKLPYPKEIGMVKLKRFYYHGDWHRKHLKLYWKVAEEDLHKYFCDVTASRSQTVR